MIKNHANTTVIEEICAGCGMPKTSWKGNNGRGYWKGEETIAVWTVLKILNAM